MYRLSTGIVINLTLYKRIHPNSYKIGYILAVSTKISPDNVTLFDILVRNNKFATQNNKKTTLTINIETVIETKWHAKITGFKRARSSAG